MHYGLGFWVSTLTVKIMPDSPALLVLNTLRCAIEIRFELNLRVSPANMSV